jgi:hypothetical protein
MIGICALCVSGDSPPFSVSLPLPLRVQRGHGKQRSAVHVHLALLQLVV